MKYSIKNSREFGWEGVRGWAYNTPESTSMSGALIKITGRHGKIKNLVSDRFYFVIKGEGEFEIDGVKHRVAKNDLIIVKKKLPYDYKAINGSVLELVLIDCPPFVPQNDVKLENSSNLA